MQIDKIFTTEAPSPGGAYSQGIGAAGLLILAGQVGLDPTTGAVATGVAAQTQQALRNLEAVIRAAGGSLDMLVKTTCFLASIDSFAEFNEAYAEVMGDRRPARSTVGVELPGEYLVEIEGIAVIG